MAVPLFRLVYSINILVISCEEDGWMEWMDPDKPKHAKPATPPRPTFCELAYSVGGQAQPCTHGKIGSEDCLVPPTEASDSDPYPAMDTNPKTYV